ncbi:hypothetical protein NPIL_402251, partial [Nephila pilipes]
MIVTGSGSRVVKILSSLSGGNVSVKLSVRIGNPLKIRRTKIVVWGHDASSALYAEWG